MRDQSSRRAVGNLGARRGKVIALHGDVLGVQVGRGAFRAERAVSCLVEPAVGDLVLVDGSGDGAFVLAVLARAATKTVRLVLRGDAELHATGTLALRSESQLRLGAPAVDIRASNATVFIERLAYWGSCAQALLGQVKLCASSVESTVDRVSERAKQAFRTVEGLEQLRAGRIDYRAEQDVSVRGENAVILTRNLTKIDGKQIHLG